VALGRHVPEMQFIAVLFGDEPVVTTDVAVYQRLLKGDETGARGVVEAYVKQHADADVHAEVLLPVLSRVRTDATRGALTVEESAFIAGAIARFVDELDAAARAREDAVLEPPRAEAALHALACPARDEVDAAALRMLASRVASDDVRFELTEPGLLAAEVVERAAVTEPGVVVVGTLCGTGLSQARYLIKRLRARFPDLPVVAACWMVSEDADDGSAALLEAGATDVATTLPETRDRMLQYRRLRADPAPPRAA
jgi:hypothetical protein